MEILDPQNAKLARSVLSGGTEETNGHKKGEGWLIALAQKLPFVQKFLSGDSDIKNTCSAGMDCSVEVVCSRDLGQQLLAQAAVNPGVTKIYDDLLTFKKGTSEIYFYEVPNSKLVGKTFKEVKEACSKSSSNVIPIGIFHEGEMCVNPSDNNIVVKAGDLIYAICDNKNELWNALGSTPVS